MLHQRVIRGDDQNSRILLINLFRPKQESSDAAFHGLLVPSSIRAQSRRRIGKFLLDRRKLIDVERAHAGAVDCVCFVQPTVATPLAKTGSAPARARNWSASAITDTLCGLREHPPSQKPGRRNLEWTSARCSGKLRVYLPSAGSVARIAIHTSWQPGTWSRVRDLIAKRQAQFLRVSRGTSND